MSFVEPSKGYFPIDGDDLKTRLILSREATSHCQGGKKREQSNAKRFTAGTELDSEAGDCHLLSITSIVHNLISIS